jgi:MFS family permease
MSPATTFSAALERRTARADRRGLVLVVVAVAQLMVVLDATIVNIALPSAQQALGFSNGDRQWVVTAYALSFGSLLLVGGRLVRQPQAGVYHRSGRIRHRLGDRRRRRLVRRLGHRPGAAGGVRRCPCAVCPGHSGEHVH